MSHFILFRICLAVGVVVFAQISYASFKLSQFSDPRADVNTPSLTWNPFFNDELAKIATIELTIVEARQHIEFMTFAFERAKESARIRSALQAQINIQPFDQEKWSELIQLQRESKVSAQERIWTIEAGLLFYAWTKKGRARMSAGCVEAPSTLFEAAPEFCGQLLVDLSKHSIDRASSLMGIKSSYLKQRLAELESLYSFSAKKARAGSK